MWDPSPKRATVYSLFVAIFLNKTTTKGQESRNGGEAGATGPPTLEDFPPVFI